MPEFGFPIRKAVATPLWLAGTLSMAGCLFHKPPRAYVPPPIYAPPQKSAPLLDLEPRVVMASLDLPSISWGDLTLPPWKPAPTPPKVTPPKRPAVAQTPPPPVAPPETPPPVTPPKITPLYSPQQTQESTKQLEEILGRVEQVLANAAKKGALNGELQQQVETIKTYRQLAQDMRERDLMTAVELAKRAEVFANELQKKL